MQVESHSVGHLQQVSLPVALPFSLLGHGSLLCNPSIPSQTSCLLRVSGRSHQRDPPRYSLHLAFLYKLTASQCFLSSSLHV